MKMLFDVNRMWSLLTFYINLLNSYSCFTFARFSAALCSIGGRTGVQCAAFKIGVGNIQNFNSNRYRVFILLIYKVNLSFLRVEFVFCVLKIV